MNPNPRVPKPAGNGEPKQPIGIPSRPAVAGFAPFSWDLSYNSIEALPPPIPDRLRSLRILEPQEASDNPTSSSPPQSMTEAMLASAIGIIVTPTPVSRSGYSPPVYSLPKSYEKDFKVKQALGFGAFGEVAIVRVIAADDGGIAHGFRLRPGIELVAKKIRTDPIKQHTIYSREWNILDTLRGHRNLLHAVCTQQPRIANPYGHIFMEYCDLGDLSGLMKNYKDDLRERKQKHGFSRFITPKEFLWLGALPEGVAYEVMTNVARGLAWMQYGIRDWPRDSAIDPDWTAIMHNDIKPDNVFMVSREPGDECPYPIFKIGDLGAASKTDTVAFVGNTATASPERLRSCMRIPSVPEDDIFSLGSMMFLIAHDVLPFHYDGKPHAHMILGDPYEKFETISCPKDCSGPHLRHFKGPRWTARESDNGPVCEVFLHVESLSRSELKYPPPYAKWWHNLVDHCLELERQDRPHIIEVLERLYLGRRGRREDNVGNPLILWDPFWLSEEEQRNLKAREHEVDKMWENVLLN